MSNVFFYEPFHDFERLVNEVLAEGKRPRPTQSMQHFSQREDRAVRTFRPRMDLHEDFENNIVTVTFELPGVSKEAIDIQLQNNRLTVSAESKRSTEHGEDGYAVRERMFGKYSRTLQLPRNIQENEIQATMENGLLTLRFPRVAPEGDAKRITIA